VCGEGESKLGTKIQGMCMQHPIQSRVCMYRRKGVCMCVRVGGGIYHARNLASPSSMGGGLGGAFTTVGSCLVTLSSCWAEASLREAACRLVYSSAAALSLRMASESPSFFSKSASLEEEAVTLDDDMVDDMAE
jgi:hypothetical protein